MLKLSELANAFLSILVERGEINLFREEKKKLRILSYTA